MVITDPRAARSGWKMYDFFLAAFVCVLMVSNIIAGKLIQIGPITLTAAVFIFPLSYIFGDVLTEVYGYAGSRRIIWLGFGTNILMSLLFLMAIVLPYPSYWTNQVGFSTTLGVVPRIVLASIIGYWVGEFCNSFVLAKMKEWMVQWDPNHRHLWMRTISSTIVGEFADTIIFIFLAFVGSFDYRALLTMMLCQYLTKVAIEIVFTPITYLVVGFVKKREGLDIVGTDTYSPFKY